MSKPLAALTFDDGPSEYTPRILDTLARYGAKASFFVVGLRAEAIQSTVKRTFDEGHEVIVHAWGHPNLTTLSADAVKRELQETEKHVKAIIGTCPNFYRPPYGKVNDTVKQVSAELGYAIINWTVEPFDWECQNAELIHERIMADMHDGAIILVHDLYDATAAAMERTIPALMKEYELVTVSELFSRRGITLTPGEVYTQG